ncbi:hypothetical protein [Flammeovirga agarivorans]|uniref:Uncharacterized protein n=1 Tax=Flammeovirga agarivorans TaxID=2726742 RepID=A0A7X8SIR4_9BACT|nr:hypothetical protein [Flammeovirga agarivorans]NLR90897.1 hypothetical protein [Flammeovirga agarivorans]
MNTQGKLVLFYLFIFTLVSFTIVLTLVSLFSGVDTVMFITWVCAGLGIGFVGFTGMLADKSTNAQNK